MVTYHIFVYHSTSLRRVNLIESWLLSESPKSVYLLLPAPSTPHHPTLRSPFVPLSSILRKGNMDTSTSFTVDETDTMGLQNLYVGEQPNKPEEEPPTLFIPDNSEAGALFTPINSGNDIAFALDSRFDDDISDDEYVQGPDEDSDHDDSDHDESDHNESDHDRPRKKQRQRAGYHFISKKAAERAAKRTDAFAGEAFLITETGDTPKSDVPGSRSSMLSRRRDLDVSPSTMDIFNQTSEGLLTRDDELIITMREKGYTDQQIVNRLTAEGRWHGDVKSLPTRVGRIKQAQAKNVDFLLEEGYKEWEFDDDVLLLQAYEYANIDVNYEIERARAWRFKKVAEFMRRLNKDAVFSEKACRDRYEALMNGTAAIPSDLDDDPMARREEMERFRLDRETRREAEAAEKAEKAEAERMIRDEAAMRQAQKADAIANARQKRMQEKCDRAMVRAANNQIKLQKAQENKEAKARKLEEIRARKAETSQKGTPKAKATNPNLQSAVKHIDMKTLDKVTATTPDPRRQLTMIDLQALCLERGLDVEGRSVEEYIQRLRDADDTWTLQEIKNICRSKGLITTGNKTALKYQLAMVEATKILDAKKHSKENTE